VFPIHTPDGSGGCSCGVSGCRNIGKHPRTPNGLRDATTDPARISQWWTVHPEANIAIATGKRAGAFVVDVDPAAGGYDTADNLQARHGAFPATLAAQTGGDGLHIYLAYPAAGEIRNSAGKLGPGIDIRAEGGYAVLPPSLHVSGNRYAWTALDGATDIAPAPAWLLSLLVETPAAPRGPRTVTFSTEHPIDGDGGTIPEGQRNSTLTRKGGLMRRYGFTESEILATLERMNADRCDPQLPDKEVERIAKSVARYAPEPPGPSSTIVRLASGAVLRPIRTGGRYGR
jgi:putative DNA primase/helicase